MTSQKMKPASVLKTSAVPIRRPSVQRKTILIIEDEPGVRIPLVIRLKNLGFSVSSAHDGQSGLDEAYRLKPDLILLDLMLPRLSGEEVCKTLREDEDDAIANIPIIMMTAKDSEVDRMVGRIIGSNAYLTKPFDFDSLHDEMKKLGLVKESDH